MLERECTDCPVSAPVDGVPASMFVFANPAVREVNVTLSESLSEDGFLRIYNAIGLKIWEQKTKAGEQNWQFSLNGNEWKKGIYLVTLKSGSHLLTECLLIQ
jgi:hypothetical protein